MHVHKHPSGRGPDAADHGLGRELTRLGELRETTPGRALGRLFMALVALLVLTIGAAAVLLILGLVLPDLALAITGLVVGLVGLAVFGPTAVVAYGTLRSWLVIFENGIVAHQSFRGPRVIPWSQVAGLLPPNSTGNYSVFYARLITGKLVGVARLKLPPQKDQHGAWGPHPDTALVLEHYAAWCRQHGRPARIRSSSPHGG